MPNITVSVDDEELVRRAKAVAALRGKSVSELVRESLRDLVDREQRRETGRERFRSLTEEAYSLGGRPLPREQVHER